MEDIRRKYYEKVLKNIEEKGWHTTHVLPTEYAPGFVYTTGLKLNYNHSEIIMFGLTPQVMEHIIINAIENIRKNKIYLPDGQYNDLIEGYLIQVNPVHRSQVKYYMKSSKWFYNGSNFDAVQFIWPEADGMFPDHPQINPDYLRAQPILKEKVEFKFTEDYDLMVSTDLPIAETKVAFVYHQSPKVWHFYSDIINMVKGDTCMIPLIDVVKFQPELNQFFDLNFGDNAEWCNTKKEWFRNSPFLGKGLFEIDSDDE